jgi:hypothetical protein
MTLDKKLVNRIYRQQVLAADDILDYQSYDDIVAMKWDGIPNLKDEDYYVEFIDTTGRDIVQQAVNIYSTQKPKWDILPRGIGDIDTAEEFERVIEWYMWKAAQCGETRFHDESMISACKYNKICGQLEWLKGEDDYYYFHVSIYHPSTVRYEYGVKLNWVSVVNNVSAVSIVEKWQDYESDKGIEAALKKIEELANDDPEQRMMYVDYTDKDRRYVYCYPVSDTTIDDSLGYDDDGKEQVDCILIQDKKNALGFINWSIARGVGDPLLAPLLKGGQYDRINDEESILRTKAMRIVFEPMYMQEGREDADADIDYSGGQVVMKVPTGARMTKMNSTPLDPAFSQLVGQDRGSITESIGISSSASMQTGSNVQNSTLTNQIKLRLAQLDPYKKVDEQFMAGLAYLMFKWAKKKDRILKGQVLYDKNSKDPTKESYKRGEEIDIDPEKINLDALYIECRILPNNENDKLQITNQISMLKQSGIHIPDDEFIEMLYMGDPSVLNAKWEKQELNSAVFQAKQKEILNEVDISMQKQLQEFGAMLQVKTQEAMMQMQQAQAQGQGQGTPPGQQGAPAGQEAAQQGQPMPSDAAASGMGADAGMGGMPPQEMNPGMTQQERPQ